MLDFFHNLLKKVMCYEQTLYRFKGYERSLIQK